MKRRLQRARTASGGRLRFRSRRKGDSTDESESELERALGDEIDFDEEPDLEADLDEAPGSTDWGESPDFGELGPADRRRDRLRRRLPRPRLPRPRSSDRSRRLPRPSRPRSFPRPSRLPRPSRTWRPSGRAGAALAGIGTLLRSAGSGAAQGLKRGGQAGREAAGQAGLAWRRSPLAVRRGIAAVLAAGLLAGVVAFVLIPNAPCSFPGGDRCPPTDDAITLVPDNALLYLHANVEADDDQFEAAQKLAGELPQLALDIASSVPALGEIAVDFSGQVGPWAADEVAVAFFPDGFSTSQVALIEIGDADGARAYAEGVLAAGASDSMLNGITITSDPQEMAFAEVEGYLAIGDRSAVGSVVRTGVGELDSLSEADEASDLLDQLPERNFLTAYVSELGLGLAERIGALGAFDTFVDSSASRGVGAALVASDDDLELVIESELDPGEVEESPGVLSTLPSFDPQLPSQVGDDALALLTIGDATASIGTLLAQATTGAPDLLQGLRRFARRLEAGADADVEQSLLDLLGSETALTVEPPTTAEEAAASEEGPGIASQPQTPYLGLIVREVDEEAAMGTLAGLQAQIAAAVNPRAGGGPTFTVEQIDGIEAQILQVSQAVELAYGFVGDTLVAGSSPVAIERFADGGDSLADDDRFEAAVADFPERLGLLVFFDLEGLVRLGEAAGLATDPSFAQRAPELRSLADAALAVTSGDQSLRTQVRLTFGEPPELPPATPDLAEPEAPLAP